jgi:hypothetical protein
MSPAPGQPWIHSATLDGAFILAPAFVVTLAVMLMGDWVRAVGETPPLLWLVLIVGVDVAHVWSTVFRTYLDRTELAARRALYVLAPLVGFVIGVVLYRIDAMLFWRALAYLAAFHFVRQQFGFVMIYRRAERADPAWARRLDQTVIYAATLYPLLAWHCQPREFEWFMPGDFLAFDAPAVARLAGWLYLGLLAAYVFKEAGFAWRRRWLNLPKNLMVAGTALSWYVGILAFDNDLAFTATNVIAHGVPYLALMWVYGHNQQAHDRGRTDYLLPVARLFQPRYLPAWLALLFAMAYLEEGLWDGLVWRDHATLFPAFAPLPGLENAALLSWIVPLLALPQITHYLLDAFIWRMGTPGTPWKDILFLKPQAK